MSDRPLLSSCHHLLLPCSLAVVATPSHCSSARFVRSSVLVPSVPCGAPPSVCSLQDGVNRGVVQQFASSHPLLVDKCRRHRPYRRLGRARLPLPRTPLAQRDIQPASQHITPSSHQHCTVSELLSLNPLCSLCVSLVDMAAVDLLSAVRPHLDEVGDDSVHDVSQPP